MNIQEIINGIDNKIKRYQGMIDRVNSMNMPDEMKEHRVANWEDEIFTLNFAREQLILVEVPNPMEFTFYHAYNENTEDLPIEQWKDKITEKLKSIFDIDNPVVDSEGFYSASISVNTVDELLELDYLMDSDIVISSDTKAIMTTYAMREMGLN